MRRRSRAEISHKLGDSFIYESAFQSEFISVYDAVIAFIRGAEPREFFGIFGPIKFAAVDYASSNGSCMTLHVFGSRVSNYVSAPFKRTAVDGSSKGVVHNERNSVVVSGFCKLFYVKHRQSRVGYSLAENRLSVRAESRVQLFLAAVWVNKSKVYAHAFHRNGEKIERSAIYG